MVGFSIDKSGFIFILNWYWQGETLKKSRINEILWMLNKQFGTDRYRNNCWKFDMVVIVENTYCFKSSLTITAGNIFIMEVYIVRIYKNKSPIVTKRTSMYPSMQATAYTPV